MNLDAKIKIYKIKVVKKKVANILGWNKRAVGMLWKYSTVRHQNTFYLVVCLMKCVHFGILIAFLKHLSSPCHTGRRI